VIKLNLFQIHFQTIQMMKVIVAFISQWETPTWPPSIQMGSSVYKIYLWHGFEHRVLSMEFVMREGF
jgi:hypothetical protein